MKQNITIIALFSLISLSISPTKPTMYSHVDLQEKSAICRIFDYAGITPLFSCKKMIDNHHTPQKTVRSTTTSTPQSKQQYSSKSNSSPIAIAPTIKELKNPTTPQSTPKRDYLEELQQHPHNPMPNPQRTPFKV